MILTISETIDSIRRELVEYLEATYHISDEGLIAQRRVLLDAEGNIFREPYVESTPKYRLGENLETITGFSEEVLTLFSSLMKSQNGFPPILYNPPFKHQYEALLENYVNRKSLIVMTGTGSGKTECFLIPILAKLAREASANPTQFAEHTGIRTILLYPMNALVNDQLGRLRHIFGDPRVRDWFINHTGRPVRFARYTSRTLYPGVRTSKKDSVRLKALRDFYIHHLEVVENGGPEEADESRRLINHLQEKGKWPSKPDLLKWFGKSGTRWQDSKTGEFKRCVTLDNDSELLTRHEVHTAPPDILVTNYSMLEYMLLRPLEKPVFDCTREWLNSSDDNSLLLVLDESHLYRGAGGTEVALLLRRLTNRLGISPDSLQVICTSASFQDRDYAKTFGAQLSGKSRDDFLSITGDLQLRDNSGPGDESDIAALRQVSLPSLFEEQEDVNRLEIVKPFLKFRGVSGEKSLSLALYQALSEYPPFNLLVNLTMKDCFPIGKLSPQIFPSCSDRESDEAITVLMALGSLARRGVNEPGLMPCRIHCLYRGLPGLWACLDPNCPNQASNIEVNPTGTLYAQPRQYCECGAIALELYTCRSCGTAYARGYTDNAADPSFLWNEAGEAYRSSEGTLEELEPLDLLLEEPPSIDAVEVATLDCITGRINPYNSSGRTRTIYLRKDRIEGNSSSESDPEIRTSHVGEFRPCAVCGSIGSFGRSSVQDHQTKGDEPFQTVVRKQLEVQPPEPVAVTRFAPLRGRKVLVFSDSRPIAARLAPNLQRYSIQDALRPLIVYGFNRLETLLQEGRNNSDLLSLEDLYLSVLMAAEELGVRLRPELKGSESLDALDYVSQAIKGGEDPVRMLLKTRTYRVPGSLLESIHSCLTHPYYGMESLALCSIVEQSDTRATVLSFPEIAGIAESDEQKLALTRAWIRLWRSKGFRLSITPNDWIGVQIKGHRTGRFREFGTWLGSEGRREFEEKWLPSLLTLFTEKTTEGDRYIRGAQLTLKIGGEWSYCTACKTVQRPYPGSDKCLSCGLETARIIDTSTDPVFVARKGYYRKATNQAIDHNQSPISLIAAEHTAQLNVAQQHEAFSRAELHELLFQDVEVDTGETSLRNTAIDVLSCTTTMEVGIDIGKLSGVAMRNMPPARANYQQRAGRAGRRGNAIATVLCFGSSDSHDEHFFTKPEQIIRGAVEDPILNLDNRDIVRRHITAFLLQNYHQEVIPEAQQKHRPALFSVLGSVADFKKPDSILSRDGFKEWIEANQSDLASDISSWIPAELSAEDRTSLLDGLVSETMEAVDSAIEDAETSTDVDIEELEAISVELAPEVDVESGVNNGPGEDLLNRLLYKGVLPRYAFPTDVATFYVFNRGESTDYRHVFSFSPSQGLAIALSQYAPGKDVWIAGKRYQSGAIYSPITSDTQNMWQSRKLYFECGYCEYGETFELSEAEKGEIRNCPACGQTDSFGPAKYWIEPPGFAHPVDVEPDHARDDLPEKSRATRAKLLAPTPSSDAQWVNITNSIKLHYLRKPLLVTNSGPKNEGYNYCTYCKRIEPTAGFIHTLHKTHQKPYPSERDPSCDGHYSKGVVLGTDFLTDVLLVSFSVKEPVTLKPGLLGTFVALRTISEALNIAACERLELESREIGAEFRPALTPAGIEGKEAEIFLYDLLPGGGGFTRQLGEIGRPVFERALQILEECPENCDRSCYKCLRSYRNKFEHHRLDRYLGASLLRYLMSGDVPSLAPDRIVASTEVLFSDLVNHKPDGIQFTRDESILVPGLGDITIPISAKLDSGRTFALAITNPLTPDYHPSEELRALSELSPTIVVKFIDDLQIRQNLPRTTLDILGLLTDE